MKFREIFDGVYSPDEGLSWKETTGLIVVAIALGIVIFDTAMRIIF